MGDTNWLLNGNSGTNPSTDFLGTTGTPAQPLVIKTNNTERMRIDVAGNVGIGHPAPDRNLTVYRGGATAGVYANVKNDSHEILVGVDGTAIVSAMTNSDLQIRTNNTSRMVIKAGTGNVGVGTANPREKLDVSGQGVVRSRINSDSNSGVRLVLNEQPQWSVATVLVPEPPGPPVVAPGPVVGGPRPGFTPPKPVRGNFQIYNDRVGRNALCIESDSLNVGIGTTEPALGTLQVNGNIASARVSDGTNAGFIDWYNLSNKKRWHLTMRSGDGDKLQLYHNDGSSWSGAHLNINPDGNVGIGTSSPGAKLEVNGDVKVSGDILLMNADCAEDFDIVEADKVEPGTVMVIDQEGALRQSHQAYDKRVAGVTSGAGDYKPGIVLDKHQSQDDNRMPIALVGKVYCKVDAQYSPVEVGDLLTTSATPGHAMKAENALKAFGAVIGKALRPLKEGQGLIPILIALQ
jgi:hypothetical protein